MNKETNVSQHELVKVAVVGCWHQGVVGAGCMAELGYDVTGYDPDAGRVAKLAEGSAPLYEPGLDELLGKGLKEGRLAFTGNLERAVRGARYVMVMFDTPVDENDQSDLSGIFAAFEQMAPLLDSGVAIYVTAQVPVGTCRKLDKLLREKNTALKFHLAYSPENLRLGQAIERFMKPALPVIGSDDPAALDAVEELFRPLNVKWERVNLCTAEMVKHALNAFLATSVCFANEIGNICDEVGADGSRLAQVLRLEPRIGSKALLLPGLGFSGGTLARDMQTLRGLGDRFNIQTLLLDGAWDSNQIQNQLVVRKMRKALGGLTGKTIAVLGLTYKPDTSTLRRSASLQIIRDLNREGAQVRAHDPKADRGELKSLSGFEFFEDVYEAVRGAEAVVIVTGWPEYKQLDFAKIKGLTAGPVLLDTNNMLNAGSLLALGFMYMDIGRGRG
ncbi:MAG: nucleotide sugar dehydrogenase [Lentisphaerota bacterium]